MATQLRLDETGTGFKLTAGATQPQLDLTGKLDKPERKEPAPTPETYVERDEHPKFGEILAAMQAGVDVLLVGPAGSGKTTICSHVAGKLGLPFFCLSIGPETLKSDLLGYCDGGGRYHSTPVRAAFERGGILLLDEFDAGNAGSLTILNSLLANRLASFPDRPQPIRASEDFKVICAANTFGRGADRRYCGRNQLDAATLDRFAVIEINYDENLERTIAPDKQWTALVQKVRHAAEALGIDILISPRASIMGGKLLAQGLPIETVKNMVLYRGIARETIEKIEGNI